MSAENSLILRKVITGHDTEGKAVIIKDEPAENVLAMPSGHQGALIWAADRASSYINGGLEGTDDPAHRKLPGIAPPDGGHVFRILNTEVERDESPRSFSSSSSRVSRHSTSKPSENNWRTCSSCKEKGGPCICS